MVKKATKRLLNLGIGFSAIGKDKVQQLGNELEKKYNLSSREGKKLARDLVNMTQKTSKQVVDAVNEQFHFVLKNTLGMKKATRKKIVQPARKSILRRKK